MLFLCTAIFSPQLEDLQSKLSESQQSAKQAHDIMRYMLEEKPNLDASLIDCLSEYMKGTAGCLLH